MTLEELKNKWPILWTVGLEHGPGWYKLIDSIMSAITLAGFDPERDEIRQIKEKFGTLRIYVTCDADAPVTGKQEEHAVPERWMRVHQAIQQNNCSATVCEQCGQPGRLLVSGGWWSTRCAAHAQPDSLAPAEYAALRELNFRGINDGH